MSAKPIISAEDLARARLLGIETERRELMRLLGNDTSNVIPMPRMKRERAKPEPKIVAPAPEQVKEIPDTSKQAVNKYLNRNRDRFRGKAS